MQVQAQGGHLCGKESGCMILCHLRCAIRKAFMLSWSCCRPRQPAIRSDVLWKPPPMGVRMPLVHQLGEPQLQLFRIY